MLPNSSQKVPYASIYCKHLSSQREASEIVDLELQHTTLQTLCDLCSTLRITNSVSVVPASTIELAILGAVDPSPAF